MLNGISPMRWSAILVISATSIVINAMPAIVTVLGRSLHWSDAQLGYFASADVIGYTAGTMVSMLVMKWHSPRLAALAGVVIVLIADLASATTAAPAAVLALRGAGGVGAGLAAGATWYVLSLSHQAANNGLSTAGQTGLGFLAVIAIPWVARTAGLPGVFVALAALAIPALLLVGRFPASRWTSDATSTAVIQPVRGRFLAPWIATVGVATYFLGQGALWTYLGLIGAAAHLSQSATDASLGVCAAGLFVGSMLILVVPAHTPRGLVLGLSLGLTGVAIVGLSSGDAAIFLLSSAVFGLLYPIFPAFQFEIIARSSTAAAVTTLTAAMIGFSCGPLIAGRLVERFGYSSLHWLAGAGCTVALLTLVPLLRRSAKSRASTLEC